ncbi:MAG: carbohydrate binding domain-containing protein, partial [Sedimentisphaerales bacterium]|nr:carbohydrate binding domain-containing protein [Sedimentisphaerales bacterium]
MCRTLFFGVSFILILGLLGMPAVAQNQIRNWEFDETFVTGGGGDMSTNWWLWEAANFTGLSVVQGAGLSGDNAMMVAIPAGASGSLQVYQSFLVLEQGVTYTISFMAKADEPRTINVRLMGRTLYNWRTFWGQTGIQLTTEPQTFTFQYEHTEETVGGTGVFNDDIDWCFDHGGSDISAYYDRIWLGQGPPPSPDIASKPVPEDGAIHEDTWVSLSWEPGSNAVSHDVYLGDNYDDVANGAGDTFRGNQKDNFYLAGFPGYAYPEGLVQGTTYYWRVDEINDENPNSPWKGDVWSFTIPSMEAFNP